jgi:hypothetical protein
MPSVRLLRNCVFLHKELISGHPPAVIDDSPALVVELDPTNQVVDPLDITHAGCATQLLVEAEPKQCKLVLLVKSRRDDVGIGKCVGSVLKLRDQRVSRELEGDDPLEAPIACLQHKARLSTRLMSKCIAGLKELEVNKLVFLRS